MVQVRFIVVMLTVLNLLNWVDRGLIAGAGTLIKGCVMDVDHCGHIPKTHERCVDDPDDSHAPIDTCSSRCRVCGDVCHKSGELVEQTGFGMNDFALGLVQSSFMVGYMCGSFIFSKIARGAKVYRVLAYGMIVWTISALISGFSGFLTSYSWSRYMLTLGRILSGVGEAALATVALPHLDDILPETIKGRYLALYFSAIPVGNALGFVFAGAVSAYLSWKWTFLIEAMLMPPFVLLFLFHPKLQSFTLAKGDKSAHNRRALINTGADSIDGEDEQRIVRLLDAAANEEMLAPSPLSSEEQDQMTNGSTIDLWDEIMLCLKSFPFVMASAGLAMFTFTAAGLSFYMPMFLQSYRPCDHNWDFTEGQADAAFGAMVLSSGFLGVLIGGWILDISPTRNPVAHALKLCVGELVLATGFLGVAVYTINVKIFFGLAWFGTFFAFMTTAPVNRALLGAVPFEARPIAMALSVVIGHLFGDVPSPILIGAISDAHSPFYALGVAWLGFVVGCVFWAAGLYSALKNPPHLLEDLH